jgi:DNA-binding MarR family transcriptional regulator
MVGSGMAKAQTAPDTDLDLGQFEPPEFLLAQLNGRIREMMNAILRGHGLKLVEWRVLQCLHDTDRVLTIADLADLAVIDRTVASRLIDRMTDAGLVSKQPLEQDRRFSHITSTDAGMALFRKCDSDAQNARVQLFSGFSNADVADLTDKLTQLLGNATFFGRRPPGRP